MPPPPSAAPSGGGGAMQKTPSPRAGYAGKSPPAIDSAAAKKAARGAVAPQQKCKECGKIVPTGSKAVRCGGCGSKLPPPSGSAAPKPASPASSKRPAPRPGPRPGDRSETVLEDGTREVKEVVQAPLPWARKLGDAARKRTASPRKSAKGDPLAASFGSDAALNMSMSQELPKVLYDTSLVPDQVTCYACGRQFGTMSIAIHQKTCLQKHQWGLDLYPKGKRKVCLPAAPPLPYPTARSRVEEFEEYNAVAGETFTEHAMTPCHYCQEMIMERVRREGGARRRALEMAQARMRRVEDDERAARGRREAAEDAARRELAHAMAAERARIADEEEERRLRELAADEARAAERRAAEDAADRRRYADEEAAWRRGLEQQEHDAWQDLLDAEQAGRRWAAQQEEARRQAEEEEAQRRKEEEMRAERQRQRKLQRQQRRVVEDDEADRRSEVEQDENATRRRLMRDFLAGRKQIAEEDARRQAEEEAEEEARRAAERAARRAAERSALFEDEEAGRTSVEQEEEAYRRRLRDLAAQSRRKVAEAEAARQRAADEAWERLKLAEEAERKERRRQEEDEARERRARQAQAEAGARFIADAEAARQLDKRRKVALQGFLRRGEGRRARTGWERQRDEKMTDKDWKAMAGEDGIHVANRRGLGVPSPSRRSHVHSTDQFVDDRRKITPAARRRGSDAVDYEYGEEQHQQWLSKDAADLRALGMGLGGGTGIVGGVASPRSAGQ